MRLAAQGQRALLAFLGFGAKSKSVAGSEKGFYGPARDMGCSFKGYLSCMNWN